MVENKFMKKLQTQFIEPIKEISEEDYYYFLEIVPPTVMAKNAFLLGEANDHAKDETTQTIKPRYRLFFEREGKFFYGGLTFADTFKSFLINY